MGFYHVKLLAFMSGTRQQEVAYIATLLRDAAHIWRTMYLHTWGGRIPLIG